MLEIIELIKITNIENTYLHTKNNQLEKFSFLKTTIIIPTNAQSRSENIQQNIYKTWEQKIIKLYEKTFKNPWKNKMDRKAITKIMILFTSPEDFTQLPWRH